MKIPTKQLATGCMIRPVGYLTEIMREGSAEGGVWEMTEERFARVREWVTRQGDAPKGNLASEEYRTFFDLVEGGKWRLPAPQKMPTLLKMAGNLAKSAGKGVALADEAEVARREEICNGCEYYTQNVEGKQKTEKSHRCILCGCFMNLKRRQAAGECDAGKW